MQLIERTTLPASHDVNMCCGLKTKSKKSRYEIEKMTQPPATMDKWLEITFWQCIVVPEHKGQLWETTNEDEKPSEPVYDTHSVGEECDICNGEGLDSNGRVCPRMM